MAWQPQDEPLRQLAQYLFASLNAVDPAAQKNAEIMLKHAKASPDFSNYLAYLLSQPQTPAVVGLNANDYHVARSAASIMLKNTAKAGYKTMPDENKNYLRSVVLTGLGDANPQIRLYSGSVITEMVKAGGIMAWPHLLADLIGKVENKDGTSLPQTQEGAMAALVKICEDNTKALDREYHGERPLTFLFPKLLDFTKSQSPAVRANALTAINVFLPDNGTVVAANIESLLLHLFNLTQDPSSAVRKQVCRAFIHILEIRPGYLMLHMEGLVDYTVAQQQNEDDSDLALDAAELWLCVGENEELVNELGPYLPKIVPVLLVSMVYSEDDIMRLEGEEEDAHQEDREQDIKPVFATTKGARHTTANGEGDANSAAPDAGKDDLSEGEIEDDDDDYGGDPEEQWNLRKCSAAALDVLATYFHGAVFDVTLPYLLENLEHPEWPRREAAVLALGAIAEGCMDVVQPHLPQLTPFLLSLLSDKVPVVRQITCWTLGRYSSWAAHLDDAGRQQFFEPIMDGILQRMLDSNKRVQEAASSAFASLEEKAESQLIPYAGVIIQQFVACFGRYKDRNMFILYDCVQTLAEHVGPRLQNPELVNTLMPALLGRWQKISDASREMFPLLECLSYVATALHQTFAPYAEPIFTRCIRIIHSNLEDGFRAANNPGFDSPNKDFLVTSLDLLSAIIQALSPEQTATLVASSKPNVFELLTYCMQDSSNDVRQSAYALLGDSAIYAFDQIRPFIPSILDILIQQLDPEAIDIDGGATGHSVVNNACWSAGEIAVREKTALDPYVDRLLEKLASILFSQTLPRSLIENAAIALGRLGTGCAEKLAPHLAQFAAPLLNAMHTIVWTDEKGHALLGFNRVILANPRAMEAVLLQYFAEIAGAPSPFWLGREGELRLESCKSVIAEYQRLIPNFDEFISHLPAERLSQFRVEFQL